MDQNVVAVILGLVEGITEFLPVSSTGHLILVADWLNFLGPSAHTFEIVVQSGAILAVLLLYWRRFSGLFDFRNPEVSFRGRDGIFKLAIACLPAFVFGALLHSTIKLLFSPIIVAAALVVGGFVMLLVEGTDRRVTVSKLESLTYRQALIIGLAQCLALWPGVSRSGATIIAGMLLGLSRSVAAEFSFLVAAPILVAATCFELFKNFSTLTSADVSLILIGFVVSFLSALIAVKGLVRMLSSYTLRAFGVYRIILGLVVVYLLK